MRFHGRANDPRFFFSMAMNLKETGKEKRVKWNEMGKEVFISFLFFVQHCTFFFPCYFTAAKKIFYFLSSTT